MFRHKNLPVESEQKTVDEKMVEAKPPLLSATETTTRPSETILKDLMEKNLKWSQIIYEQNRKINNKLMWSAIANWLRMLVIVVPLALAIWFIAPQAKNIYSMYQGLLNFQTTKSAPTGNSLEQIMKLFPLNTAQQEQLKAIIK